MNAPEIEQGSLARIGNGPVMLVKVLSAGFAYCVWFDEGAALCHGTFRVENLRCADRQSRTDASTAATSSGKPDR